MTELTNFQKRIRVIQEQRKLMKNATSRQSLDEREAIISNLAAQLKPVGKSQNRAEEELGRGIERDYWTTRTRLEEWNQNEIFTNNVFRVRQSMMNASTRDEALKKFENIQRMYLSFAPLTKRQKRLIVQMKKQDESAYVKTINRIEKSMTYFDRMVAYAADTPIGAAVQETVGATRKRVGAARNQVVGSVRKTVGGMRNRAVAVRKTVGGIRNRAVAAAHEKADLVRNTVEARKQNVKVIGGAWQDITRALHAWQRLKNRAIYVPNYLRGMVSHFTANGTRNVKERAGFKKALRHRDMILSRIGGRRAR